MVPNHLKLRDVDDNIIVLGDVHINSSLSEEFESNRLSRIAKYIRDVSFDRIIVLAGDTFDRNVPSLVDIKLFYQFIKELNIRNGENQILVINGNHDVTTFFHLPNAGFRYIATATVVNEKIMLVPYNELSMLEEHLKDSSYPNHLLISHARCTIPPYIKEEVSINLLSESFNFVILGDIHTQPTLPYENVKYTTSPSSIHFTKKIRDAHGAAIFNLEDMAYYFKKLPIPGRIVINCDSVEEVIKEFSKKTRDYRKIRFSGGYEELQQLRHLKAPYVIKDFTLITEEIKEHTDEQAKRLADFLSSKVSMSSFAFQYFKDTIGIKEDNLEEIRQAYEKIRTKKGSHK